MGYHIFGDKYCRKTLELQRHFIQKRQIIKH